MFYKKLYAIFWNDEDYGYVSGISYLDDSYFLNTTKVLLLGECLEKELPLYAPQIASIKIYSDKEAAQEMIEEFAMCANVSSAKNLVARELDDRELKLIDRSRRAVNEQNIARAYARQFRHKKLICPKCGNKSVPDMIVSETNFHVMSNDTPIHPDECFQKKTTIYCNKCGTQIPYQSTEKRVEDDVAESCADER